MASEGRGGSFFGGFLLGSIIGIVAGILFAPKPGRDLRADLMRKGKDTMDQAQEQMEEMEQKGKEVFEQAKSQVGKAREAAQAGMEGVQREYR